MELPKKKGLTLESLVDPNILSLQTFQGTKTLMYKYYRTELLIVEK